MRLTTIILILCLSLLLSAAALAQDAPAPPPEPTSPDVVGEPSPPPPPAPDAEPAPDTATTPEPAAPAEPAPEPVPGPPPAPHMVAPVPTPPTHAPATAHPPLVEVVRSAVMVGPTDSQGSPVRIAGRVTIAAKPSPGAKVAKVELFIDGKTNIPIKSGFWTQFDSTRVSDGPHTLKAVGRDASGKQVWTATTKIQVANKKPAPTKPALAAKPIKPVAATVPGALTKVYTSARHGFAIHYPVGWVASDKTTAMRPRAAGNGWVAFSAPKKTDLVVNVRRMRLEAKTDADRFAKFNPYVTKWERKTVLGAQAFATNTDDGNRIIHRLIVIKDGYAWMLNCVDAAGKTSDTGQKLFDSMTATFATRAKAPAKH